MEAVCSSWHMRCAEAVYLIAGEEWSTPIVQRDIDDKVALVAQQLGQLNDFVIQSLVGSDENMADAGEAYVFAELVSAMIMLGMVNYGGQVSPISTVYTFSHIN